jgi:hypothetical protein
MKKSGLALSSAPLWTNLTDAFRSTSHAAGLVSVSFNRRVKYVSACISQTQWYVLARDHVAVLCSGLEEDGCDGPIPKWKTIHTLTLLNDMFLHCFCQYYCRVGLPCAHLLSVINNFSISMAIVKWWKVYHYYGLHNTEITHQLNLFQSQQGKPYLGALIPHHLIPGCSNEFYPCFSSEILNNHVLSCIQHVVESLESAFLISDCPILNITDADLDAENISFTMENKENNDEGSTVQSVTTKNSRCQLLS